MTSHNLLPSTLRVVSVKPNNQDGGPPLISCQWVLFLMTLHARRPSFPSVIWGHSIPFFKKSTTSQAGCTYQNICCDILHFYVLLKQFNNHFFPHKISLSIHYLILPFKFIPPKRSKSTCSEFSHDKFHTLLSDVIICCIRVKPHSSLLSRKNSTFVNLHSI